MADEVTRTMEPGMTTFPRVRWGTIFAGLVASALVYMILSAFGMAIGGGVLEGVIEQGGGDAGVIGFWSAAWIIVSVCISLFVGSYFASKVSELRTTEGGRFQGAVIAGIFFALMIGQAVGVLRWAGQGVASISAAMGQQVERIAQNPRVQQLFNETVQGLDLQSSPSEIVRGLTARLVNGQTDQARDYLISQSGLSAQEATQRLQTFQNGVQSVAVDVGKAMTDVVQAASWTMFLALVLGSLVAIWGGSLGIGMRPGQRFISRRGGPGTTGGKDSGGTINVEGDLRRAG